MDVGGVGNAAHAQAGSVVIIAKSALLPSIRAGAKEVRGTEALTIYYRAIHSTLRHNI
jgi:hypothetical protein